VVSHDHLNSITRATTAALTSPRRRRCDGG